MATTGVSIGKETFRNPIEPYLEMLDFRQNDLAEAREAFYAGDHNIALVIAERLIRSRLKMLAMKKPVDIGKEKPDADNLCKGFVRVQNMNYPPQPLSDPIDWNYWANEDGTWNEHFGNMYPFDCLHRTYSATGEKKYADAWCRIVNDFLTGAPYLNPAADYLPARPMYLMGKLTCNNGEGRHWMSLSVAGRIMHWLEGCGRLADSDALTSKLLWRILKSIYTDHYCILVNNSRKNTPNQYSETSLALTILGMAVPWFYQASAAFTIGYQRFRDAIESNTFTDGTDIEQSPNYNFGALKKTEEFLEIIQESSDGEKIFFKIAARNRLNYLLQLCTPDLHLPDLAKSHASECKRDSFLPYGKMFDLPQAVWMATGGKEGTPPSHTSAVMPYGGYSVLRSGFTGCPDILFFKSSRIGAGHMHEDELGIILHGRGRRLLVDSGNYTYAASSKTDIEMNAYSHATRSHNTVLVDGLGQKRQALLNVLRESDTHHPPMTAKDASKLPYRHGGNDTLEYLEGVYADGYGENRELRTCHVRQIVWLKQYGWLVIDTMIPNDNTPHTYQQLWQLAPEFAEVTKLQPEKNRIVANESGNPFTITAWQPEPMTAEFFCGDDNVMRGWYSSDYGIRTPKPDVWLSNTGTGCVCMIALLQDGAERIVETMSFECDAKNNTEEIRHLQFADGARLIFSRSKSIIQPNTNTDLFSQESPAPSELINMIPSFSLKFESAQDTWQLHVPTVLDKQLISFTCAQNSVTLSTLYELG